MTRRSIAAAHTRVCFLASAVVRISPPRRALITAFRAPLHRRLRERLYVWRAAGHEVRPRQVIHDDIRTHANIVDVRRRGMSEVDMTVPLFIKDRVTVHALSVIAVQLKPTTLPPAPFVRIPSSGPRWLSCRIVDVHLPGMSDIELRLRPRTVVFAPPTAFISKMASGDLLSTIKLPCVDPG